ncbi:hypothetical protein J6590_020182 [Homalodisca vitripennis]|nr:hypothetical protein J6590_020182 [Homalodisca vitripennis]
MLKLKFRLFDSEASMYGEVPVSRFESGIWFRRPQNYCVRSAQAILLDHACQSTDHVVEFPGKVIQRGEHVLGHTSAGSKRRLHQIHFHVS